MRRALRIWPLYYAALAVCLVSTHIPRAALLAMSLFVVNWSPILGSLGAVMGPLWSISVEEQFYLVLAPVVKMGGQRLALAGAIFLTALASFWIWLYAAKGWTLWYDTPVEFLFFAAGVIICLATHRKADLTLRPFTRRLLMSGGLLSLVIAAAAGGIGGESVSGLTVANIYISYAGAMAGCAAIFISVLGRDSIPPVLIYLGRISYGLYVFHGGILELTYRFTNPLRLSPIPNIFVTDGVALFLSIVTAHFSYKFFEMPFLKLKQRFEVVKSRPL
jgi:peptidoglycan/LPS O-acetylase OafA/YrhL